ncbi:Uncharacterised protein [uncultured archaeon]|nr:Uncharacterised protein [uncultured archaeon]
MSGFLASKNISADELGPWFTYLVTEQMARELGNEIENMKKRLKSGKKVEIVVESLEDRSIFAVPADLNIEDVRSLERDMLTIGKDGDVVCVKKPVFTNLKLNI